MIKIKVCGMRNMDNIRELCAVGPDFIGFIFHEQSPRNVKGVLKTNLSKSILRVGVFVDKDSFFIEKKVTKFKLDYVQLHGKESPEFCKNLNEKGIKVIKAFNLSEDFDFDELFIYEPYCDFFLLDASGEHAGGNGVTFNWDLLKKYKSQIPFLLSGGINEKMVKALKEITHSKFMGVDINSGFEIAPGLKSINKIKIFSDELRSE